MKDTTRRVFLFRSLAGGCSAALPVLALAATHVDEADEVAVALGYHHDTRQVDGGRYPAHTQEQRCAECSFWQGSPTDEWSGCAMFGRKQVAGTGWCSSWTKK